MIEIKKVLRLPKLDYYEVHLSLINCVLPSTAKMTPMEIKVLATFMSLEGDIAEKRFGASGRKIVQEKANIGPSGLSNYLGSLSAKKLIHGERDNITILPLLFPEPNYQDYRFRIIKTPTNENHQVKASLYNTSYHDNNT